MPFTINDGEFVVLRDAQVWTRNYRGQQGFDGFKGQFFGADKINQILAQQDCVGIRIYSAKDAAGNSCFVLVGASADEEDLYNAKMVSKGPRCPDCCAANSPLNA